MFHTDVHVYGPRHLHIRRPYIEGCTIYWSSKCSTSSAPQISEFGPGTPLQKGGLLPKPARHAGHEFHRSLSSSACTLYFDNTPLFSSELENGVEILYTEARCVEVVCRKDPGSF